MCFLGSKKHKYFIVSPAENKIGKRDFWECMAFLPVAYHLQRRVDLPSSLIIMKQAGFLFVRLIDLNNEINKIDLLMTGCVFSGHCQ